MTAGLQIYALSCRTVSEITLASLDRDALQQWKQRLVALQDRRRYELAAYTSLELFSKFAPYCTIRTIYSELQRLLLWGNPLRGVRQALEQDSRFSGRLLDRMCKALEKREFDSFSKLLEELLLYELRVTVNELSRLGVEGVNSIRLPEKDELCHPITDAR